MARALDYYGMLAGVAADVRGRRRGGVMNDNLFTPDELDALTQLNEFCRRWIDRLPHYEGSLLQDFFELYADTGWLLQQHRERLAEDPLEQIPRRVAPEDRRVASQHAQPRRARGVNAPSTMLGPTETS
jgi:hypothetical protein